MKGIYYDRNNPEETDYDDWHQPAVGEKIVVSVKDLRRFFPEKEIQGKSDLPCGEYAFSHECSTCFGCGRSVEITFFNKKNEFDARYYNGYQTHLIGEFSWVWSGHGVSEQWFDERAIALKSTGNYRSRSGLTANSSRIVAYNRKVKVSSFREDCGEEMSFEFEPGEIFAGFINGPAGYRANWTGLAISPSFIGDDLDRIIRMELGEEPAVEPTVCRHNRQVQIGVVTANPKRLPYFLCLACRMNGVRWEEFTHRNRRDTCPYFRRACKSVVGRSEPLPPWFEWQGNNLVSSRRRLSDGDWEAYEVIFVRKRNKFVRRAVLLLNNQTHKAVMYRYNGFIPRTLADFKVKYGEGRVIQEEEKEENKE